MKLKSIQCVWIQLRNWNSITSNFNSIIGLRFNWNQFKENGMQIGGECIEYLLVNMVLAKKTSKRHKY